MKNVRTRVISGATLIRALAAVAAVVAPTAGLFTSGSALAADSSERTMAGQKAADKSIIDIFGGGMEDEESFTQRKEQESREIRTKASEERNQRMVAQGQRGNAFRNYDVDKQVAQDVAASKQGPEYQKMKLGEAVKGRFASLRGTQAYKAMNQDEQSNSVVKLVAEEAAKMNMPGIASKAAKQYVATQRSAQKAKDEQYKLGVEKQKNPLDVAQLQRNVGKDAIAKRKANSPKARAEEAGTNVLEKDVYIGGVNQGAGGIVQPDGSIILNGQTVPPGRWHLTPPVGEFDSLSDLRQHMQETFLRQHMQETFGGFRTAQITALDELDAYGRILDTIEKSYDEKGNLNILGAAGTLTKFGGNFVRGVRARVRISGGTWDNHRLQMSAEEQESLIASAGPEVAAFADRNGREEGGTGFNFLKKFGIVADNRERFNSQLIVAAYALAPSWAEGGKVANSDFTFALRALAGASTNPQVLVDILMKRAATTNDKLENVINGVQRKYWNIAVGPKARASYKKEYQEMFDIYSRDSTHPGRKTFTFEDGIQYPNTPNYVDPNIARARAAKTARILGRAGSTP